MSSTLPFTSVADGVVAPWRGAFLRRAARAAPGDDQGPGCWPRASLRAVWQYLADGVPSVPLQGAPGGAWQVGHAVSLTRARSARRSPSLRHRRLPITGL